MNAVILSGNIARDPVIRATQTGKTVASFTVVTERKFQANGKAYDMKDYINCVAWGQQAEVIGNVRAGASVEIKGRIGSRSYESNGEKRWVTEVTAEDVNIIGQQAANPQMNSPQGFGQQAGFNQQGFGQQSGFSQFGKDENIPF